MVGNSGWSLRGKMMGLHFTLHFQLLNNKNILFFSIKFFLLNRRNANSLIDWNN